MLTLKLIQNQYRVQIKFIRLYYYRHVSDTIFPILYRYCYYRYCYYIIYYCTITCCYYYY